MAGSGKRTYNNLGKRIALAGGFQIQDGVAFHSGSGFPLSGTSGTTVRDSLGAPKGSIYIDKDTGVQFVNEGTSASPYWSPCSFNQYGLIAAYTDWRADSIAAITDTTASVVLGSGVRLFGAGLAQTDSGGVITRGADGAVCRITTSATTNLPIALGIGSSTVPFDPATNGPLVIDANFTVVTDLLTKRVFMGFGGTAADGLVSPVTGSTVTLTLVQDDIAGMMFDSGMTAASEIFAPHNKVDEAASILATATGVDLGTTVSAVGTYQRWRVEISAAGTMTCFINKVQKTSIALATSTTVDLAPMFLISSTSSAVDSLDVKHFATWGKRVTY